jgi:S1-C subfamily serine protease
VIGISFMLLSAGVGAAFSGAAFYAYYDNRLAENERAVSRFVEGFDQQFSDAAGALDELRTDAVGTIRSELAPLEGYVADATAVVGLPQVAGASVWLVETRDDDGRPVVGSAFAVVGHRGGTALVTSLEVVATSTVEPAPAITLVKDGERIAASLWAWDEQRDLALLVVDRQIPVLSLAGEAAQVAAVGRPVYAMAGTGGQGASAAPGVLIDQSSIGLQHTVPIGTLYRGGPLLDGAGQVVGVATGAYQPLGVDPGLVGQAPEVSGICARVLLCSETDDGLTVDAGGD